MNLVEPLDKVAVVIPCYRCEKTIGQVVGSIPDGISRIYCVNDASDDNLAPVLSELEKIDNRVNVIEHKVNGGVGAATISGYKAAIKDGANVIVKIDSDGQMDPALIADFAVPILKGDADYVKGNRFFDLAGVRSMPIVRLIGNAGLSFFSKLSTGYWHLFDPTNGYTAIHAEVADHIELDKLHKRYFFESDLLFRLSILRARVQDLPMASKYGAEISGMSELDSLVKFPVLHARNFFKRIFYNYFLRNFSLASVHLLVGALLVIFGTTLGLSAWINSFQTSTPATAGTVMLSALPVLAGIQFVLNFINYDIASTPARPIHPELFLIHMRKPRKRIYVSATSSTLTKFP